MVVGSINSFYKNKRVFITGHTGFKGSWLMAWLQNAGASLKGYALAPENSLDLYSVLNGTLVCESVIADIRDHAKLKKEILDFKPDVIFHMAAQPLVRQSYLNPLETFEVNTLGTAALLDAVRFLDTKCSVVVITTDKVYENQESGNLYTEKDRLGGHDPYSSSKAAAELVTTSYRNSFFDATNYPTHQKSIATARAGNVIGGGDWNKDRIIPDIVKSLKQKKPVMIRNPNSVRPWQHVLDPTCGYLLLGMKLYEKPDTFSGAWNFGPRESDHLPVKELVKLAISCWGQGTFEINTHEQAPHETNVLKLDISKALGQLGWEPEYTCAEAIQHTIDWYKQTTDNLQHFTVQQLKNYKS